MTNSGINIIRFRLTCLVLIVQAVCFFALPQCPANAQEETGDILVDEADLFSDSESVMAVEKLVDETVTEETQKAGISISGTIYDANTYATRRDDYILKNPYMTDDDSFLGIATANLLLDARYKEGIKGFANADLVYTYGDVNEGDQFLRELFFDVNIRRAVYFRIGKQYLKWGNNFWNPSDLINVDKKDFLDPDKNIEGVRGIKIHVPFGTDYNLYGFVNLEDVGTFEDISWSGKFEFLLGDTELAFSGWYKEGFDPVFGFDFSTRLLRMDIRGEFSLSSADDRNMLIKTEDGSGNISFATTRRENRWAPKASLSVSRSFEVLDVNDRLIVSGEIYFDDAGYDFNAFENLSSITLLMEEGLYAPNYTSKYYAALYTTLNRFIVSDALFSANVISNLTDGSKVVYTSIAYNPLYDMTLMLNASFFIGNGNDEYTFSGNDHQVSLEFHYRF